MEHRGSRLNAHVLDPEDVVWFAFPEWPDGGEARNGHDGVRESEGAWTDSFDEWTTVAESFATSGDRVLVLGAIAGRVKDSGVPIRQPWGYVCSDFRSGQMGAGSLLPRSRTEALEAAGLSE